LDFHLPMQSVLITSVVSLNSAHGEVYSIQRLSVTYDRSLVFPPPKN